MSPPLPTISGKRLLRALERAGFYVHHQTGSHARLHHRERSQLRVTIPVTSRELKRKTLVTILRQAEMSVEDLERFL